MSGTAPQWFKSSYSDKEGGACLEVAYTWRKSTPSASDTVHVRDSKNPQDGPTLQVTPTAWTAFTAHAGG